MNVRRVAIAANLVLFAVAGLLVAAAQPPSGDGGEDRAQFGRYALTYSGRVAGPGGRLGASGGLVVFDGGAGAVDGRLDSSPSSSARAASVAPGTLVSTVAGQVNTNGGRQVVVVPTVAQANHPGETKEDRAGAPEPQKSGPFVVGGVTAAAKTGETTSEGTSRFATARVVGTAAATDILATELAPVRRLYGAGAADATRTELARDESDVLRVEGGTTTGTATADPGAGTLDVSSTSTADEVVVAGQIVAESVKGVARAGMKDGKPTTTTGFGVASLSVGGVPVTVDEQGVRAQDTDALSGEQVRSATTAVNDALAQAGVSIRLLRPIENVEAGSAQASSGGIEISITTPSTDQVPGNVFAVVLGGVDVTLSTGSPVGSVSSITGTGSVSTGTSGSAPGPSVSSSTTGGAPPVGGEAAPPQVAPEASAAGDESPPTVAGFTGTQLLAGFAAWQLLTLSIPTLASYAFRRRDDAEALA